MSAKHTSRTNVNSSGGKIPPIPMCEALRDAIQAEASANERSPRDQALQILRYYYRLTDYHPNRWAIDGEAFNQPDLSESDVDSALAEIERLSGDGDE